MSMDYINELARVALAAECRDNERYLDGIKFEDALAVERDRVIQLLDGQVAMTNATVGQKAIWNLRPRSPLWSHLPRWEDRDGDLHEDRDEAVLASKRSIAAEQARATRRSQKSKPLRIESSLGTVEDVDLDEEEERLKLTKFYVPKEKQWRWWAYYDTVEFVADGQSTQPRMLRAYGATNVGDVFRTNLQIPGGIAGGHTFRMEAFHAVPVDAAFNDAPWDAHVTFVIGNMPYFAGSLAQAFLGMNSPISIPPRQNFYGEVWLRRAWVGRIRFQIEGLEAMDVY